MFANRCAARPIVYMPDGLSVTELLLQLSLQKLEIVKLSDKFRSAAIAEQHHPTRAQIADALYSIGQARLMIEQAAWHLQPGSYPASPKEVA